MADPYEPVVRVVTMIHKEGFHTRPVMKFVDLAQRFVSEIRVVSLKNRRQVVNGKSAMELMLLGATHGTRLRIEATGPDAGEAADALVTLVANRFDLDS